MNDWISDFTQWLVDLVKAFIKAIWDFCVDVIIELVDLLLSAFALLLDKLPAPDFLSQYGFGSIICNIDSSILFFVNIVRIPEGLGLLALGFAFRMLRKVFTLFQW
jgi:hypothetical protein